MELARRMEIEVQLWGCSVLEGKRKGLRSKVRRKKNWNKKEESDQQMLMMKRTT